MTQPSDHPSDDPVRPAGSGTAPQEPTRTPSAEVPGRSSAPDGTADERPAPGRTTAPVGGDAPGTEPVEVGRGGGRTAGLWISLILGAIVLVMLLIFVIQNNHTARFQYFATEFDLPLGVAMLLAAIAGALVMALVGSVRMVQMSWTIRKMRKQQEKIHRATR
ncbi:LapA family protein [Brachybacterium sp. AOP43-C2-M15]|uniref:LapA family protein n=1 Tax=Brachybacterium sp. AOP43-C2-M15 TaxID=3457661 RepID=UPI0040343335